MHNTKSLLATAALVAALAGPALSQGRLVGTEALDERITDIERDAARELARGEDAQRFGPNGVPQGWRGSVALTFSAASGNSDNVDLAAGGRLTYGVGNWAHSFGLAAEYGESSGVKNEEEFFATYESAYYFNPRVYGFGIGRYEYDGFATNEHDLFFGAGPGIRIVNTDNVTWRVQAGPGVRHIMPAVGSSSTEFAGIVSSRFFYKFTDTVSLTNDTDVLGSNSNILATNDIGINVKLNQTLSTRVSYRTDYNSDPAPGFVDTDNTFGVSLVVGF